MRDELRGFYEGQFAPEYKKQNAGEAPPLNQMFASLSAETIALQARLYLRQSASFGLEISVERCDRRNRLFRNTSTSSSHRGQLSQEVWLLRYLHRRSRDGHDCVLGIQGTRLRNITDLPDRTLALTLVGPFQQARRAGNKDDIVLVDFEQYGPSYEAPASFIASPIFDADTIVGVALFQMPLDGISSVMGQRAGLGKDRRELPGGP